MNLGHRVEIAGKRHAPTRLPVLKMAYQRKWGEKIDPNTPLIVDLCDLAKLDA
jgi:hypothetical protein